MGFVEQEDLVSTALTVRQNLQVAARLRLPESMLTPGQSVDCFSSASWHNRRLMHAKVASNKSR